MTHKDNRPFIGRFLFTADDFGYSPKINAAIARSVETLSVQSVSLIVNGQGFADAINLLRNGLEIPYLGLHVNLTEGKCLSSELYGERQFCDENGTFIHKRAKPIFMLRFRTRKAIAAELQAQIDRFSESGRRPDHIDSHHHIHTEWSILRILLKCAKENGIHRIRIARNTGRINNIFYRFYRALVNGYLKYFSGMTVVDYFGDADDIRYCAGRKPFARKRLEVMIHPTMDDQGRLIDLNGNDLEQKLSSLLNVIGYS